MKRSKPWSIVLDAVIAAGCVALLSYLGKKTVSRRRREEKLDSSLVETFPASDPITYQSY